MADEIGTSGKKVGVFMSPTKSFVLPEDKSTDIIMVGPGTGIAPFRAFMEQRVFDGGDGRNWLFFGDQSAKTEFYYKDEIESWIDQDTSINLPPHGLETKKRRFTSSTALRNMAQKFGSGSKTEHTFTSVAIRPTWQKMSIVL